MLPLQMPEGKWQRHINAACKARNENHLPSLSSSKAACEFFMVSWIDVRKTTSSSIIKNISCICICIYLFLNFSISLFIQLSIYLFIYLSTYLSLSIYIYQSNNSDPNWPQTFQKAHGCEKKKLSGLQAFDQHRMPSCPAGMITSTTHPDPSIQWSKVSNLNLQSVQSLFSEFFRLATFLYILFLKQPTQMISQWELVPVSGQLEAFS